MLNTMIQGHRSIDSEEEFLEVLPYMDMAAILIMQPRFCVSTFLYILDDF